MKMSAISDQEWKKLENENGFPFYFNEKTKQKQLDHPNYEDLKQKLDDCNYIKYAIYRVAWKFRILQKNLFMEKISLTLINGVFEKHKLGPMESSLNLEVFDLEAILSDIYFAANKQYYLNIDIDLATDLMINLIYNIYDRNREGNIQVSCAKLLLALLSDCKVSEFYNFLFKQCSDHNYFVTRLKLQNLLSKLVQILCYLNEDVCFGHYLISSSVESCFSTCIGLIGINQTSFLSWLETNPPLLSWFITLYRLRISEGVTHNVKCSTCRLFPITGLRYKCTKCINYSQCQQCFFAFKENNSHKSNHLLKEYCVQDIKRKDISFSIFKKLLNALKCSSEYQLTSDFAQVKLLSNENTYLKIEESFESNNKSSTSSVKPLSSPEVQLQLIIKQLEQKNKELKETLSINNYKDKNLKKYLEEHRSHIAQQVTKLKGLQEYLKSTEPSIIVNNTIENKDNHIPTNHYCQSTPMTIIKPNKRSLRGNKLNFFSPVPQMSQIGEEENQISLAEVEENESTTADSLQDYSVKDISTWFKDRPIKSKNNDTTVTENETTNDLDDVLVKLQQILANNFILDEDLDKTDNDQLQHAVTEVEYMLSSLRSTTSSIRSQNEISKL